MTVYYLDPKNGNNANNGTSWALAKKTPQNLCATYSITSSDEVRVAKNTPAVDLSETASYTAGNWYVTMSASIGVNDFCNTFATGETTVYNSATKGTTTNYGTTFTNSASPAINGQPFTTPAATANNTKYMVIAPTAWQTTAIDLSGYQEVWAFMWHGTGMSGDYQDGMWRMCLCSDGAGATIVDDLPVEAIDWAGGSYTLIRCRRASGNLGNAIKSIAIYSGTASNVGNSRTWAIPMCPMAVNTTTSKIRPADMLMFNRTTRDGNMLVSSVIQGGTTSAPKIYNRAALGLKTASGMAVRAVTPYLRATTDPDWTDTEAWVDTNVPIGSAGNYIKWRGGFDTATGTQDGYTCFGRFQTSPYLLYVEANDFFWELERFCTGIRASIVQYFGTFTLGSKPHFSYKDCLIPYAGSSLTLSQGGSPAPHIIADGVFTGGSFYLNATYNGTRPLYPFNGYVKDGSPTDYPDYLSVANSCVSPSFWQSYNVSSAAKATTGYLSVTNSTAFLGPTEGTITQGNTRSVFIRTLRMINTVLKWKVHSTISALDVDTVTLEGTASAPLTAATASDGSNEYTTSVSGWTGFTLEAGASATFGWVAPVRLSITNITSSGSLTLSGNVQLSGLTTTFTGAFNATEITTMTNTIGALSPAIVNCVLTLGNVTNAWTGALVSGCTITTPNTTFNMVGGVYKDTIIQSSALGTVRELKTQQGELVYDNCTFKAVSFVDNAGTLVGKSYYFYNCTWTNMGSTKEWVTTFGYQVFTVFMDRCVVPNGGIDYVTGQDQGSSSLYLPTQLLCATSSLHSYRYEMRNINNTEGLHKISTVHGVAETQTATRHTASGYAWKFSGNPIVSVYGASEVVDRVHLLKLAVKENQIVYVRLWCYVAQAAAGAVYKMWLKSEAMQLTATQAALSVGTTQTTPAWEQITLSFTPTVSGVMDFYVAFRAPRSGSNFQFYWDDLTVSSS